MSKQFNAFAMAQQQFDAVAEKLGLDPGMRELLRWPRRELHFTIPVKMDSGQVIAVVVMALFLTFIATLYPAWRAARLCSCRGGVDRAVDTRARAPGRSVYRPGLNSRWCQSPSLAGTCGAAECPLPASARSAALEWPIRDPQFRRT